MNTPSTTSLRVAAVVVCALAITATGPVVAQTGPPIGDSKSNVVWIGVGIVAAGAGIGVGVYYTVHHKHSLTGCAVSGASGLELQNKRDQQTYALVGTVSAIKPGEHVRVSGKRIRERNGSPTRFLVEQLAKDFGRCEANAATP